jgi:hypothetical protein
MPVERRAFLLDVFFHRHEAFRFCRHPCQLQAYSAGRAGSLIPTCRQRREEQAQKRAKRRKARQELAHGFEFSTSAHIPDQPPAAPPVLNRIPPSGIDLCSNE